MISLLSIVALGFFLGMRHVTDPDHALAVTTILSRQRSVRHAALMKELCKWNYPLRWRSHRPYPTPYRWPPADMGGTTGTPLQRKLSACVDPRECLGEHQPHEQSADSCNGHIVRLAKAESPDSAHQQIADQQIKKAPQHVDPRRRESLTRRRGEG